MNASDDIPLLYRSAKLPSTSSTESMPESTDSAVSFERLNAAEL